MDSTTFRFTNQSCFDLLANIPTGSIDLVLIDPPYLISRDTGFEYVFDGNSKQIVTDIRDAGTFNIVPGNVSAKGHALADVLPYVKYGSGPADDVTYGSFGKKTVDAASMKVQDKAAAAANWTKEKASEALDLMKTGLDALGL